MGYRDIWKRENERGGGREETIEGGCR
jgi:hypothetical protein